MAILLRVLSLLPSRLLYLLGWPLGWAVFLLAPHYRRRFIENAVQAGYALAEVRAAVGQAGRMVTELPKVWAGRAIEVRMDDATRQVLDAAWAAGRGVLLFTPHLGCFELSAQSVARHWGDARGPLTVLYRPARKAWLARQMQTIRNRHGQEAVPTDMGGVRAMLKRLRKGGAVGLLPDQVPPWGMGIWSDFFGRPAYTMTIAARLVMQTRPSVLVGRCERLPWGGGYQLHVEQVPYDEGADQEMLVRQMNAALEAQIRACPQQYLWGYARYKWPRGMPVDAQPPGNS
ncbi:lysophospholipid acyltransferase family protein [Corticibacter populi]|uniref:Lysophospholipid acyltransferase family protein n=1 Tax=Corticibacter populi TaxID=1550736 RepID=A0A3M6QPI1_9BURK|nr:lysophospholipid acyltransferase family protein [Corticibacter populi]RMX04957.1 lysophospholipid acyltransferase family protein [Corticibacter populi]RZS33616.1 KDO2-lipid IV(A) lauroyltransferase [Corticibacter populi]